MMRRLLTVVIRISLGLVSLAGALPAEVDPPLTAAESSSPSTTHHGAADPASEAVPKISAVAAPESAAISVPGVAGAYNGTFFVRDSKDVLRLYVQGRAMLDYYSYYGAGVEQVSSLTPTFLLRKVRLELGGELYRRVQWFFGGDFGMNSTGLGANQSVAVRAAPADVYVNFKASPLLNLEVGQFDQPFSAEGRTADKCLQFMERSIAVRVIGKGNAKDNGLMLWGNLDKSVASYAVALVQGDGMNRPNVDHRFDVLARVFVRPLAHSASPVQKLQIGGSIRRGSRDGHWVDYDYSPMTTEGGYVFWKPTYGAAASANNPQGQTHVIPSGAQVLAAVELRVPTDSFDFSFEGLYGRENTREAQDASPFQSLRYGVLESFGYYAQVGWWPFGNAFVNGIPGDEALTSIDFSKPDKTPQSALQLLARWEQLSAKYESNKHGGATPSDIDGMIKVDTLSLGATYWIGRVLRVSANYGVNWFPDSAPSPSWSAQQRAQAPGNTLAAGVDDTARLGAHVLHELLARVQIAF